MLTYHSSGSVEFTSEKFHSECPSYYLYELEKYTLKNTANPRGHWVNNLTPQGLSLLIINRKTKLWVWVLNDRIALQFDRCFEIVLFMTHLSHLARWILDASHFVGAYLVFGWGIPMHAWLVTVTRLLKFAVGPHTILTRPCIPCTVAIYVDISLTVILTTIYFKALTGMGAPTLEGKVRTVTE